MPLSPKASFWICTAAVLILSLAPASPELPTTGWDKSNHFLGFAVLAVLGHAAYPRRSTALIIGLLLYGGLIEMLQSFTPHRLAEWADWLADAIGVAVGHGISLAWRRLRETKD